MHNPLFVIVRANSFTLLPVLNDFLWVVYLVQLLYFILKFPLNISIHFSLSVLVAVVE